MTIVGGENLFWGEDEITCEDEVEKGVDNSH